MDGEIPPLSPILPLKTTVHVILMAHISIHLSLAKLDRVLAVISYMGMEKFLKEAIRLVPTTPCTQITYIQSPLVRDSSDISMKRLGNIKSEEKK